MGIQPHQHGPQGSLQLLQLERGQALGLTLFLGKAQLIVAAVTKGYVMCGYLNVETANKLGDCAARVSGVTTLDDLLDAKINAVSETAKHQGLHEGMTGREFLNALLA